MTQTTIIPISLPRQMAKEIDRAAKVLSMTRSEFVRNTLRRQLAFYRLRELQTITGRRAADRGLMTIQDAVKAVRQVRRAVKK
ncbi:ribbon-helix-helix protein, CopG family [Candidatus Uhrbacteria bacterium]|nr:ribbon-helix-helix protein, CopG family [Candidatus Uhrbacteria bacterium]